MHMRQRKNILSIDIQLLMPYMVKKWIDGLDMCPKRADLTYLTFRNAFRIQIAGASILQESGHCAPALSKDNCHNTNFIGLESPCIYYYILFSAYPCAYLECGLLLKYPYGSYAIFLPHLMHLFYHQRLRFHEVFSVPLP